MKTRIGYVVPEFPGQTHTWIWRDHKALKELGIEAELVSTRRPKLICHAWSEEAQRITSYLMPFRFADVVPTLGALINARPVALARCLLTLFEVRDLGLKGRLRLGALLVVAGKLAALAKERGWSQLHVLSAGDAAHLAAFAACLADIDYSITLLASLKGYGANQRQKWDGAAFGLVMNEKLRAELEDELGDAVPEHLVIAPMGVDLDEAKREKPYVPWAPGEPVRLYTCGRLNPVKGHEYLFKAVRELVAMGYSVKLQVAGAEEGVPGYKKRLEALVQELRLTDNVEFLGGVSEDRHRRALNEAHVFVLASLDEGVSVAAMEAMAMQTPSVVTDVGGMRELVDPGRDALMVPAKDAAALTQAILRILRDSATALRLSDASRQKVAQHFHHRRSAEALASCLRQAPQESGHNHSSYDGQSSYDAVVEKRRVEA